MGSKPNGIPADLVQSLHETSIKDHGNPISVLAGAEPFMAKTVASALLERRDRRRLSRHALETEMFEAESGSKKTWDGGAQCTVDEPQRLAALQRMNVIKTPRNEHFDRITRLCSDIFQTKYAFITLIDRNRQWFKSAVGLAVEFTTRNESFCAFTIRQNEVFVVPDAQQDKVFASNPLVKNPPHLRFYAGAPLRSADGFNLGALCVADDVPRSEDFFTPQRVQILLDLASIVVREMELSRANEATIKLNERQGILTALHNQAVQLSSIDELYEMNALRIAEVLDVDYVQIVEFSEDNQHFILRSGFGWQNHKHSARDFKNLVSRIFPCLRTPDGLSKSQGTDTLGTYVMDDMSSLMNGGAPMDSPGMLHSHTVRSGICSILFHKDRPFGMIGVFDEHPHAWLSEDIAFLTNSARSLSVLIERIQHSLEVAHERQRADELLYTILPLPISQRLKTSEDLIADGHASVTILFADIVNFTQLSAQVTPKELVGFLNKVFSTFDIETLSLGLEKIKIIGDCYMVAGGLFSHEHDHADAVIELAADILIGLKKLLQEEYADHPNFADVNVRIGINTGPVVAGVIGLDRFLYDVWGDTVNTASRLESTGLPGHIHVSEATMAAVTQKDKFEFEPRGSIYLKGKGEMQTLFVRRKAEDGY